MAAIYQVYCRRCGPVGDPQERKWAMWARDQHISGHKAFDHVAIDARVVVVESSK